MGELGILNVGAGDTKLVLDREDPASLVRAARMIKDMLRRGYALMVEDPPGSKKYTRVREFREDTFEYIIADLDPEQAERADVAERTAAPVMRPHAVATANAPAPDDGDAPHEEAQPEATAETGAVGTPTRKPRGRPRTKVVDGTSRRTTAIAHTAGG